MNVREYLTQHFPQAAAYIEEESLEILSEMPLNSVCGESCRGAILAAASLDSLLRQGHGRFYFTHHITRGAAIYEVAVGLCILYIRG